jgi:hypothetical protein
VAGLVQQEHVLAVGDPLAGEPHAHPAAERLGEQHSLREGLGGQEVAERYTTEQALLPGQSHGSNSFEHLY